MARTDAISIFVNETDKDKLSESYSALIEGIAKGAISEQIKNTNYSGNPTNGSVEVSRFKNAAAKSYGTARTAGAGDKLENSGKVTINVSDHQEIVEEVNMSDVALFGLGSIMDKRTANHIQSMVSYLDTAFFTEAVSAASAVTTTATTIVEKIEALIQSVESTVNDWVDGVDRDNIVLTLDPATYGLVRNYIDTVNLGTAGEKEVRLFHGVRVFSNHRQSVNALCMVDGAVAQLVLMAPYAAEKINLSNDYALELFFDRGTKAVTPDLIKKLTV